MAVNTLTQHTITKISSQKHDMHHATHVDNNKSNTNNNTQQQKQHFLHINHYTTTTIPVSSVCIVVWQDGTTISGGHHRAPRGDGGSVGGDLGPLYQV